MSSVFFTSWSLCISLCSSPLKYFLFYLQLLFPAVSEMCFNAACTAFHCEAGTWLNQAIFLSYSNKPYIKKPKKTKHSSNTQYTYVTDPMRYNIKSDCELLFIAQCQVKNNSSGRRSKGPQCVLVLATGWASVLSSQGFRESLQLQESALEFRVAPSTLQPHHDINLLLGKTQHCILWVYIK